MRTARTLIRLGGCQGWSESLLSAHSFCRFCHVADNIYMKTFVLKQLWYLNKIATCSIDMNEILYFQLPKLVYIYIVKTQIRDELRENLLQSLLFFIFSSSLALSPTLVGSSGFKMVFVIVTSKLHDVWNHKVNVLLFAPYCLNALTLWFQTSCNFDVTITNGQVSFCSIPKSYYANYLPRKWKKTPLHVYYCWKTMSVYISWFFFICFSVAYES